MLAAPGRAAPAASHLHLTAQETGHLTGLLEELSGTVDNPTAEGFLADVPRLAWRLPRRLVDTLLDFRRHESSSALVLHGLPVDDRVIGPTPLNWRAVPSPSATLRQELYLMLVAGLLGEVFGWSTLQDGRLIHDIVPMPTEENEQSGHGTVLLEWHTEDGFHPYRCDYLLLLGLRNHDKVPTTVAAVDAVDLSGQLRDILFQRRFLIRPDNEHLKRAADLVGGIQRRHLIQEMQDAPEPCAVLFGHPERPYVRVDPTFMDAAPGDTEAREALDALVHQLEAGLENVALGPGELLIVDNYKAVHGRSAFTARFDGTDRWLKKAVVTRDLRKSRTLRAAPGERILL
uniref:Putative dioxygenase n=1 Tax=Streptomyces melanovinaceus TaxID=1182637 RepID=A0A060NT00_9ACTN|nr:putative dioxygenase [Streptomyces melanovinaceus]